VSEQAPQIGREPGSFWLTDDVSPVDSKGLIAAQRPEATPQQILQVHRRIRRPIGRQLVELQLGEFQRLPQSPGPPLPTKIPVSPPVRLVPKATVPSLLIAVSLLKKSNVPSVVSIWPPVRSVQIPSGICRTLLVDRQGIPLAPQSAPAYTTDQRQIAYAVIAFPHVVCLPTQSFESESKVSLYAGIAR